MTKPDLTQPAPQRDVGQWTIIKALALISLALGCIGFWKYARVHARPGTTLDILYYVFQETMKLFRLTGGDLARPVPWELDAARFLAPATMFVTVVKTFMVLCRQHIKKARLSREKQHAVICGLGDTGQDIAADLLLGNQPMVMIDRQPASDVVEMSARRHVYVITGDASTGPALRKARAEHAAKVFVTCGDDETNLRTALTLRALRAQRYPGLARCYVHLTNVELRNRLKQVAATDKLSATEVRFFNVYENSARMFFDAHPPEVPVNATPARPVHLLIVGFNAQTESLLLHLARIGHYRDDRQVHVDVLDACADEQGRGLTTRYPGYARVPNHTTCFHAIAPDSAAFLEGSFLKDMRETLSQVIICLEEGTLSLTCALQLRQMLAADNIPIHVYSRRPTPLTSLVEQANIHFFGWPERITELIEHEMLDAFARSIHAAYIHDMAHTPAEGRGERVPADWDNLPEDVKDSNRQQADHISIKLRAVDCTTHPACGTGQASFAFSDGDIEVMARMEHNRWVAERLLSGWTAASHKNLTLRQTPYLVPWDELPDDIKALDRVPARNIPQYLALMGKEVQRVRR